MPSPEKTKFGRRAIEDAKSICNSDKEIDSGIILIGKIPISLNCDTSSNFASFLQVKGDGEKTCRMKEKQPIVDEGRMYKGVTIETSKGSMP